MDALGLGAAGKLSSGTLAPGLSAEPKGGRYGAGREVSKGKDTPSGHWEIAGVPVPFAWGYFPQTVPTFPKRLTDALIANAKLPGILGNKHASGVPIIQELGEESIRTGNADLLHLDRLGVPDRRERGAFRPAAPLRGLRDRLQADRADDDRPRHRAAVHRRDPRRPSSAPAIAATSPSRRPSPPCSTATRRPAARSSPSARSPTSMRGTASPTRSRRPATWRCSTARSKRWRWRRRRLHHDQFRRFRPGIWPSPRCAGYARALEAFDARLPELIAKMRDDDLLVLTADHGNDPTWIGSDHTREQTPILCFSPKLTPGTVGIRPTFADIGESIAHWLGLPPGRHGRASCSSPQPPGGPQWQKSPSSITP